MVGIRLGGLGGAGGVEFGEVELVVGEAATQLRVDADVGQQRAAVAGRVRPTRNTAASRREIVQKYIYIYNILF